MMIFFQQSHALPRQWAKQRHALATQQKIACQASKVAGRKLASYTMGKKPGAAPGNSQSDGIAADRTRGVLSASFVAWW
jgi:hypothetical protein